MTSPTLVDTALLLDWARRRLQLRPDRQLCSTLGIHPPVISKIRHGHVATGAAVLVRILDVTCARLRDLPSLVTQLHTDPAGSTRHSSQRRGASWIRRLA